MPQRHPRPKHPIKSSVWCNPALSRYFQLFQGWQAITCFITSLYAPFLLHFPEVPTKTTKSLGQLLRFPYSLPITIFQPPGGFQPCLTQGPISYKATLVRPKKPCKWFASNRDKNTFYLIKADHRALPNAAGHDEGKRQNSLTPACFCLRTK